MQAETFPAAEEGGAPRLYMDMSFDERDKLLKARLKKYCQKVGSPVTSGLPAGQHGSV